MSALNFFLLKLDKKKYLNITFIRISKIGLSLHQFSRRSEL
jgi:hypothetical protein